MTARMPRILLATNLVPGAQFGTLEEQICILAPKIEQDGGKLITLFSANTSGPLDEYSARGIDAHYLNLTRFDPATLIALVKLVRRYRIDVVHWNMLEPIRNSYLWALTLLCPTVRHWMTDHVSRPVPVQLGGNGLGARIKRLLTRRYDALFCVSRFNRDCLEQQAIGTRLVTQYHFVNTERFRPDPAIRRKVREEQNAGDKLVAILVAYLIPEKGADVALEALAKMPPSVCLWVVGGGPEQQRLTARCKQLGLTERVRMLGPKSQVQPYLQAADVLVCPSRWAEAAGLVNLEGQACGLPVIASRIGGIPEHVVDERTGLLFEPGDSADLARKLARFIDEPGLRERLSAAARPWIVESFSPDRRVPEILEHYRNLGGRQCSWFRAGRLSKLNPQL